MNVKWHADRARWERAHVVDIMDVLVDFSAQNMGESGYAVSSWSASAVYLASMLTEGAKVDELDLAPSVNIKAKCTALPDHDSMNNH